VPPSLIQATTPQNQKGKKMKLPTIKRNCIAFKASETKAKEKEQEQITIVRKKQNL